MAWSEEGISTTKIVGRHCTFIKCLLLAKQWVYPTIPSLIVQNDPGLLVTILRHDLKGLDAIFCKNRAPLLYIITQWDFKGIVL
jgi:hypothetical protein